jgi:osmotically-inducible protein OsmY
LISLTPTLTSQRLRMVLAAFALATTTLLSGCAPLVLGSALGGALLVTDRRTSGTQVEDQGIEIKASSRLREALSKESHVNASSYNRVVLLTGEVVSEADKVTAEQVAVSTENVRSVVNELVVSGASSLGSRSNDVWLLGKLKATFVDARDVQSNAVKIIVERGEVFLMGMVTEREAQRAGELAASVKGVHKVVKVFHIITEDELARKQPTPAPSSTATPKR